jgi:hypothetical protein
MHALADLKLPKSQVKLEREVLDQVRERTLETCQRLGVIREDRMTEAKYRAGRFEFLAALAYPDADVDELVLCNDFNTYLFYVDDQAEEDERYGKRPEHLRRYFEGHIAALRGGVTATSEDPARELLLSIRERLLRTGSPAWNTRFADDVANYLMRGTLAGARHWAAGTIPSVIEYSKQRSWDSAVMCSQDLLEVAGAGELPNEVLRTSEIARMRQLCTNVVAFTNDLVSFPKEVRRHDSPNNLVHVYMRQYDLNLDQACERVAETINGDVAEFEALSTSLHCAARGLEASVQRYLAGQRAWMSGNLLWSLASGRYIDPRSPFEELRAEPFRAVRVPHSSQLLPGGVSDGSERLNERAA